MMKSKNTKRALLGSVLSMLLCMAMLVGSTFAWFTDSVTSGVNRIVAGNLDIELEYASEFDADGNPTAWESVEGNTALFSTEPVWEPGHTEVVVLRVRNAGTLALKYRIAVEKVSETSSYNADGKIFYLTDYLVFSKTEDAQLKGREAYWNADLEDLVLNDGEQRANPTFSGLNVRDVKLEAGAEEIFSVAIYMPTVVGNEANWWQKYSFTKAPSIELALNLFAAQVSQEEDSFGSDYDANADYEWDGKDADTSWYKEEQTEFKLNTPAALAGLAELARNKESFAGKTVTLGADIDLKNQSLSISGFDGHFDGNNHEISGVKSTLFTSPKGTAENFAVVERLTVTGNTTSSALVASLPCFTTFKNITVNGTVKAGKAIGGLISQINLNQSGFSGDIVEIVDCVNNADVTISSMYQAAGIVGYVRASGADTNTVLIKNCVNNGTIYASQNSGGGIVGLGANVKIDRCYNTGAVSAKEFVGGIVGNTAGAQSVITNCYNIGTVTATDNTTTYVGGIVGLDAHGSLIVDSCYSSGKISGGVSNSGIIGNTSGTGDHYTKCYYLSGSADQGYGAANKPDVEGKYIAKTDAEMKQAATYLDWDLTVWALTDGEYPTLLPEIGTDIDNEFEDPFA